MLFDESFGILLIILCIAIGFSFLCCIVKFYSFCHDSSRNKPIGDLEMRRRRIAAALQTPQQPNVWTSNSGRCHNHPMCIDHPQCHAAAVQTVISEEIERSPRRARSEYFGRRGMDWAVVMDDVANLSAERHHQQQQVQASQYDHLPPPSYDEVMRKNGRRYPMSLEPL